MTFSSLLTILLTVVATVLNSESEQELKDRIQRKATLITEKDDFKMSDLPIVETSMRNSSSCPGVEEKVTTYRLDVEDDDGQVYGVHMGAVDIVDLARETLGISDLGGDVNLRHSIFVRPYLNCLEPDSDVLVKILKEEYIHPWNGKEYNFTVPVENLDSTSLEGEVGQPREVDDLIYKGQLKNGFFIEAGAHEFETNSDSLYFELQHQWSGLLVEPNPLAYHTGVNKNRKVNSVRTCLSTSGRVESSHFDLVGSVRNGKEREAMPGLVTQSNNDTVEMQCLPLYSLLLALDNPTVHYFSLDIEGAEFPVLKSIPWDKVRS